MSLVEIGAAFGGRDHSTVIHSIRKVEESLAYGYDFPKPAVRIRLLEETVEIVKRMWTETPASFDNAQDFSNLRTTTINRNLPQLEYRASGPSP